MSTLLEKKADALGIISEALAGRPSSFVFFRGDTPGALLLHLVVKATDGGRGPDVILALGQGAPVQVGRYADKLRRLWGLRMATRTGLHDATALYNELGAAALFTSDTSAFEDGRPVKERGGLKEVRPLYSFTEAEVDALFDLERLPACSLRLAGREGSRPEGAGSTPEEKDEVAMRLKALGYI